MIVESASVVRMLLSGKGEVCWWKTEDGGLMWNKGACLIASSDAGYVPAALVRNGGPAGRMVVSEHNTAQHHLYRKMFLLGDNGPVGRPEEEARRVGERLKNLEAASSVPSHEKSPKKNRDPRAKRIQDRHTVPSASPM